MENNHCALGLYLFFHSAIYNGKCTYLSFKNSCVHWVAYGNYCTRWRHSFKGLLLDGGRAEFSKKTLPLIKIYWISLLSARSISLDSTFKFEALLSKAFHIWQASGAIMYLLESKGGGGARKECGIFYFFTFISSWRQVNLAFTTICVFTKNKHICTWRRFHVLHRILECQSLSIWMKKGNKFKINAL